ncbi:MAG: hypothetical protein HYZ28_02085 [Myxococcales bacterium]|nr:hypothetical protein [Myxococcales bacterium]
MFSTAKPALAASLCALVYQSCVKRVEPPPDGPRPFQLLVHTEEQPTAAFIPRREDVEIDTRELERTPHVVATGETPIIRIEGARARLYGNEAANEGWTVDNFVLFEVVSEGGYVYSRAAVGSTDTVTVGSEHVDNVGPRSFSFGPGEVDITSIMPDTMTFKLRATALDYGGVGRASDLYVIFEPRSSPSPDDLRDR